MQRPFYLMAKPASSMCNIDCKYCFYVHKDLGHNKMMSDEVLNAYVKNYIKSFPSLHVPFIFQGGEPTLCGIDFYKRVIELQHKYKGNKIIHNSLQTNGLLINDEFAKFLGANNFLVGISIDGPEAIHDSMRIYKNGHKTYQKVIKALEYLKKWQVEFNTLTVVSEANIHYASVVYEHLKALGSSFMQFIPLTAPNMAIDGLLYGKFLNELFDTWVVNDTESISIQHIDEWLSILYHGRSTLCVFQKQCGDQLVIEQNGDIYSCDHFVYEENKLGNILNTDLLSIINNKKQIEFSLKKEELHRDCYQCEVLNFCNGGCIAHRKNGKNTLCEGYKMAILHMLDYIKVNFSEGKK